jgi:hypothetical protein
MKYLVFILAIITAGCAGTSGDDRPIDERHRPAPYETLMELNLEVDQIQDDVELHAVRSFSSGDGFEPFLDQLWKLSFSGDASVYGVNFLGEIDMETKLEPKSLVESLITVDTVYIEDLHTGDLMDSTIKFTFEQSMVSAISIYFNAIQADGSEVLFQPYSVGIGEQVYQESSGEYLGVSNKFYLLFEDSDASKNASVQRLCIRTDSTGILKPSYFDHFSSSGAKPLEDLLKKNGFYTVGDSVFNLQVKMTLEFIDPSLDMNISKLQPSS